MKPGKNKQQKLGRLAVVTAVTLACIIALQVYWLYTSYTQQRTRFKADVTSALIDVSMYESMENVAGNTGGNGNVSSFVINITSTGKGNGQQKPYRIESSGDQPEGAAKPGIFISKSAKGPILITQKLIDTLVDSSKVKMKEELQKREIFVPFETAVINDKGKIVGATCDTTRFRRIVLKPKARPLVSDGATPKLLLQVAFPDANLYLLKRMAVILLVTFLLIIIGAWSFCYLLIHFFRQKKMADIRNDFMNNMTHELKTPISAALVAIELAESRKHAPDDTKRLEFIGIAKNEMLRLATLLDGVLKMAAYDHNEIHLSRRPQPVLELVNESIKNMNTFILKAAAEVNVFAPPQSLEINVDKTQIIQALQNLIENAIKYNDKPVPLIEIAINEESLGVRISVTDNGKGIPNAYVKKVFDKFFRVPSGDLHDIKGYGLGLSYVKAIIELHGGTITLTSREKEGSVFTFFLPFK